MTVKELIEILQTFDPNAIVVQSKDSEGNNYSPTSEVGDNWIYNPVNGWSGEIEPDDGSDDINKKKAVVFWPKN